MNGYQGTAGLLFEISAELNKYDNNSGSIVMCTTDHDVLEIREKWEKYNKKFVENRTLAKEEVKQLKKLKKTIKSKSYERLFE